MLFRSMDYKDGELLIAAEHLRIASLDASEGCQDVEVEALLNTIQELERRITELEQRFKQEE